MNLNLWIYPDDCERKFPEYKCEKYFRNIDAVFPQMRLNTALHTTNTAV